jgi:hypothetical protein
MKNLFKNKSFYLGLAATFAVAVGLYVAFPVSKDTSVTEKTTNTQSQESEAVQPAVNAESTIDPVKTEITTPVIKIQPNDGGKQDEGTVPTNSNSAGQI